MGTRVVCELYGCYCCCKDRKIRRHSLSSFEAHSVRRRTATAAKPADRSSGDDINDIVVPGLGGGDVLLCFYGLFTIIQIDFSTI